MHQGWGVKKDSALLRQIAWNIGRPTCRALAGCKGCRRLGPARPMLYYACMHPLLFRLGPMRLGPFTIGPFFLRWYGAMIGLAFFLSIPISAHYAERFRI